MEPTGETQTHGRSLFQAGKALGKGCRLDGLRSGRLLPQTADNLTYLRRLLWRAKRRIRARIYGQICVRIRRRAGLLGMMLFASSALGGVAHADTELLAYFPFDGSPNEAARGIPSEIIALSDADLSVVDGRYGQAYAFYEGGYVIAPLDIDFTTYKQISVSAWVQVRPDRTESGGMILATGSGTSGAPKLGLYNEDVRAEAGRSKPRHDEELQTGEWTHVAAIYDYDERTVRMHVNGVEEIHSDLDMNPDDLSANDRNQPFLEHPEDETKPLRRYIVIGARTFGGSGALQGAAIDDLRIFSGALTPVQVEDLRNSEDPAPVGPTAPEYAPPKQNDETTSNADNDDAAQVDSDFTKESEQEDSQKLVDWRLSKDYVVSELSGDSAERTKTLDLGRRAMRHLLVRQQEDFLTKYRPCDVEIDDGPKETPWYLEKAFKGCFRGQSGGFGREVRVYFEKPYAINSLQICQNNRRNNRIKGLRATGVRVVIDEDSNKIAFLDPADQEETNPNCKNWRETVSCADGSVASGVRIRYVERRGGSASVTGLELVCRKVEGVYE